jgi:PIN domain nuclease of toxin-antitoxin system
VTPKRLLLDTHVVLWWLADDPELSDELKETIDEEVDVFVSTATVWEVAIKQQLGKIAAPADLPEKIRDSELPNLHITTNHASAAGRLPPLHRDPFDRMLIAQAVRRRFVLVTADRRFADYDVLTLA